jgi:hypothetical protein
VTPSALEPELAQHIGPLRRVMALSSFINDPIHRAETAQSAAAVTTTTVTRFSHDLTLRGHLLSETAEPVSVEFILRRFVGGDGSQINGVAQYLNRNDVIVANRLEGKIRDRILTLHETERAPAFGGSSAPLGRIFTFQLPTLPFRDDIPITGVWALGALGGRIELVVALPW